VASPAATAPTFLLEVQAPVRGERARLDEDGDREEAGGGAGVEGWRRGGSLRQVVAAGQPGFQNRIQPAETRDEAEELAGAHTLPVPGARASLDAGPAPLRGSPLAGPLDVHPFAFDNLLLTQRRNE